MELEPDPRSQVGVIEKLTEIDISETLPTWNTSLLVVPSLYLDYGLYKAQFNLEVKQLSAYKKLDWSIGKQQV